MPVLYNVQTRQPEELDGPDLQKALSAGTHAYKANELVKVKFPDGDIQDVPGSNITKVLSIGAEVETPSQRAVREYLKDNEGAKGAAKVFLGQLADEGLMGLPELIFDHKADPLEVAKKEALKKEHAYANVTGGVLGGVGSMFIGAPLFKGAEKAGKAAEILAERIIAKSGEEVSKKTALAVARELAAKTAGKAVGGAVEGLALTAPHAITETMLGDPESAAESLLFGVGVGSAFGVGGLAAKELFKLGKEGGEYLLTQGKGKLEGVSDVAGAATDKGLSLLSSVPEKDIRRYRLAPERVEKRGQEALEQVGGDIELISEPLKRKIDGHYDRLESGVVNAKQAAANAKTDLEKSYRAFREELKDKNAPEMATFDLMGAIANEKSVLGSMSEEAEEILANSGLKYKKSDLLRHLQKTGESAGKYLISDEAVNAVGALKRIYDRVEGSLPDVIEAPVIRDIMRDVRKDIKWNPSAGEFNTTKNKLYKEFTEGLSATLKKENPQYESLMTAMADRAKILEEMDKRFGTKDQAFGALNNLFSNKGKAILQNELLQKFSAVTGRDWIGELSELKLAKERLKRIAKGEDLAKELVPNQYAAYEAALEKAKLAEEVFEPIKRLSSGSTQGAIANLGGTVPKIANKDALAHLSKLVGEDLLEQIDDINTFRSFYKKRPNGSRMVNAAAIVGNAIAGPVGGAIGAATGLTVDYFGGQMLKAALKGGNNVSGLLFAEQQMKQAAKRLDEIPEVLKSLGSKSPASPRTMSIDAMLRLLDGNQDVIEKRKNEKYLDSMDRRTKELKRFNEKASILVSDPTRTGEMLAGLTKGLAEGGAPVISQTFTNKMTQAISYLQKEMPKPLKPTTPFAKGVEWKPSDQELSKFEQKVSVVLDPFVVLKELKGNTLTKTHVDTLKVVYPKLYDQIKTRIVKEATSNEFSIPYNKRAKLSLLFDTPLDSSQTPKAILEFQKAYMEADPTVDPNNRKQVQLAATAASDVQRLTG